MISLQLNCKILKGFCREIERRKRRRCRRSRTEIENMIGFDTVATNEKEMFFL